MIKVFIDGRVGTTGLEINQRIEARSDIELIKLPDSLRKNAISRAECINQSDITFLCLPDIAAREAVEMIDNKNVKIIDASTAHRTQKDWAYGFPELGEDFRNKIAQSKRVAVPGCHASGFLALVYPLIKLGVMPVDYPVVCHSLTGYSGGGNKMIAEYEAENPKIELFAPRQYALKQEHKHLKEMQYISGLNSVPIFNPIVSNYYRGMEVTVPLYSKLLKGNPSVIDLQKIFSDYYKGQKLVNVMPYESELEGGMIAANLLADANGMQIYISGNNEHIVLVAVFDNLGKGASGAAVQCMNIMQNLPEDYI